MGYRPPVYPSEPREKARKRRRGHYDESQPHERDAQGLRSDRECPLQTSGKPQTRRAVRLLGRVRFFSSTSLTVICVLS